MMIGKKVSKQRLQTSQIMKKVASCLQESNEGFTIIESLVAILVVAILLVAIAPVLSLSVATRVQSRRVELATQAARSYIDAVRTKKIDPPTTTTGQISAFNAPTPSGNLNCNTNSYCTTTSTSTTPTNLYCIDFDSLPAPPATSFQCQSNSPVDMVIQAFRYNPAGSTANNGYVLGIRVYRADAFKNGITLKASKDVDSNNQPFKQQRTFTGGTGLSRINTPLVEMTTDISDTIPKYGDLCARFTGGCAN